MALLSAILSFAVDRGITDKNPVLGVKRYREGRRERYLSAAELERLGEALNLAEARELPGALTAIRLLALTGARRGEILGARWEYVDFERSIMILPDSKTGHKVLLLGTPALEELENATRIKGNPYICPGASPGKPVTGIRPRWKSRVRMRRHRGSRKF